MPVTCSTIKQLVERLSSLPPDLLTQWTGTIKYYWWTFDDDDKEEWSEMGIDGNWNAASLVTREILRIDDDGECRSTVTIGEMIQRLDAAMRKRGDATIMQEDTKGDYNMIRVEATPWISFHVHDGVDAKNSSMNETRMIQIAHTLLNDAHVTTDADAYRHLLDRFGSISSRHVEAYRIDTTWYSSSNIADMLPRFGNRDRKTVWIRFRPTADPKRAAGVRGPVLYSTILPMTTLVAQYGPVPANVGDKRTIESDTSTTAISKRRFFWKKKIYFYKYVT